MKCLCERCDCEVAQGERFCSTAREEEMPLPARRMQRRRRRDRTVMHIRQALTQRRAVTAMSIIKPGCKANIHQH